ncbi:MAG: DUF262 domain-containing protein [Limisphaerales bacterium]
MHRRPSTQDISWFLDQHRNGQLDLTPPYQRRSVWTLKDRRFFLDTIFKGFPCPAIFLHKRIANDGRATYEVVDGKQRLETILMFSSNRLAVDSQFSDTRLAGKKWRDLGDAERHLFWNYVLPVEQLDFAGDETSAVNDAFDRLNRNSRKLEAQELRHARFDGWLATTVENECQEVIWRTLGVVTNARAKRMKDAQFLSEMFLVLIERQQFGFDQQQLDEMYAKYDDPDEEGAELDTEDFTTRLTEAKGFLEELNRPNACVRAAAATVGAFYTLWSLIVLHRDRLPEAATLAVAYTDFTQMAAQMRNGPTPAAAQIQLGREAWPALAFEYAKALQGAHTDLTPRTTRLEKLLEAMRVR